MKIQLDEAYRKKKNKVSNVPDRHAIYFVYMTSDLRNTEILCQAFLLQTDTDDTKVFAFV
jgi:hypothetical protein